MQQLVAEALAAGAVGLSTSRTLLHLSSSGEHVPSFQAATSEMKALGRCLSGDKGHVMQFISDWVDADDEFDILRETCRLTGARGTFTLVPIEAPGKGMNRDPELWRAQLKRLEAAQAEGLDIRGQVITRPVGVLMGHPATMSPFRYRPGFRALEGLSDSERLARLRDPAVKAQILSEDHENPHIFVKLLGKRFDLMFPLEDPIEYLPAPDSHVAARAARDGRDPEEWLYDFFLGDEGSNLVYIPGTSAQPEVISTLLAHPHTVAALGDGGAHVGSICDASSNLYLLTKWVREQHTYDLAQGVRMLTRQPAELYSLDDRGLIAPGMKADINIIDFDRLRLHSPHIVADLPAGGRRFLQRADGIEATLVSGEVIFEHGEPTGALPGRLIRGAQRGPMHAGYPGGSVTLRWQIGDVTVTRVVEMETVGGGEWILPDAKPEAVQAIDWLVPDFANEEGKLRFSIHALVVETPTLTIVVDTCVGNDKERMPYRLWHQLQNDFLGDLAAAGFERTGVDVVLCTHLHVDHVGWWRITGCRRFPMPATCWRGMSSSTGPATTRNSSRPSWATRCCRCSMQVWSSWSIPATGSARRWTWYPPWVTRPAMSACGFAPGASRL